ncbi:MAG: hypothetical protein WA354_03775 [Terracidiphilus sp.]
MTLDSTLFAAGYVVEAAILILLLYKRVYKDFPVFCAYVACGMLSDTTQYFLVRRYPNSDLRIYLITTIIDSLFQFCVLVEVSMSVLRPVRSSLPRGAIFAVGLIIALACAIIWPFAKTPGLDQLTLDSRLIVHFQLTFSVIRILFFLAIAGCSQLLSIGWRDRELQIATGLGFFSIVSLTVSMLHTSRVPEFATQYHHLEQLLSASYLCSIIYWIMSFAQKVPERREFTPQMQNFLLAMAGTARSTRIALANSSSAPKNDSFQGR